MKMYKLTTLIFVLFTLQLFAQNNPDANPAVGGIATASPQNVGDTNTVEWNLGQNGSDPIPAGGCYFTVSFPPMLTVDQSSLDMNTDGDDPDYFQPSWSFNDAGATFLQIDVVGSGIPASIFPGPQTFFEMTVQTTASSQGVGLLSVSATPDTDIAQDDPTDNGHSSVLIVNAALPVSLTKFDARAEGEVVKLKWATEAELNNKGFEIERSLDGETFTKLAFVEGAGTTTAKQNYAYVDRKPSVHNYYRLKQVDFDGEYEYSEIRFVKMEKLVSEITMYPNPFSDKLNITMPADIEKTIKVYNQSGELIRTVETEDNIFQLTDLVDGLYLIRVLDQAGTELMNKQVVKVQ